MASKFYRLVGSYGLQSFILIDPGWNRGIAKVDDPAEQQRLAALKVKEIPEAMYNQILKMKKQADQPLGGFTAAPMSTATMNPATAMNRQLNMPIDPPAPKVTVAPVEVKVEEVAVAKRGPGRPRKAATVVDAEVIKG